MPNHRPRLNIHGPSYEGQWMETPEPEISPAPEAPIRPSPLDAERAHLLANLPLLLAASEQINAHPGWRAVLLPGGFVSWPFGGGALPLGVLVSGWADGRLRHGPEAVPVVGAGGGLGSGVWWGLDGVRREDDARLRFRLLKYAVQKPPGSPWSALQVLSALGATVADVLIYEEGEVVARYDHQARLLLDALGGLRYDLGPALDAPHLDARRWGRPAHTHETGAQVGARRLVCSAPLPPVAAEYLIHAVQAGRWPPLG